MNMPPEPPPDFAEELRKAATAQEASKLILLGLEVQGAAWEEPARTSISTALAAVKSDKTPDKIWDQVILFTGHRIDNADRKVPRFPASMETVAREAIRRTVAGLLPVQEHWSVLGVAGGANGGDILFLEVCQELAVSTEMALPLPVAQFSKESVENADKRWEERFDVQLKKRANVPVLAESAELPAWLGCKKDYDIWQRNNLWLLSDALSHSAIRRTLIALWDGQTGDGPGGTDHMVNLAQQHDFLFIWLNTKELFGLATQTSTP